MSTSPLPANSSSALIATDVHYRVKDKVILDGAFLAAEPGSITVLLGPNGAGKTTLLSIAQGLERPNSGDVKLLGENPYRASAALRSRVGVMLQDGGLPPSLTADRLLHHVAGFFQEPADVAELKARLGIDEYAKTTIRNLSGGQKQRLALAAALLGKPEFVFLDEPSAGLDPQSRQIVFDFILELKAAGMTILLTTHLLSEADSLADYVYLLKQGKTVAHGTVAELTRQDRGTDSIQPLLLCTTEPLSPTVRNELINALPASELHDEPNGSSNYKYLLDGCRGAADLAVVAKILAAHDVTTLDFHFRPRTLEDVFFEVAQQQGSESELAQ
ncbi:ABC transporter ATP-binding protein [Micrococcoides hystricis]|uniref:ABC transporter ATP-binding protein n=1 Tax=Micrococcoides hystricis TaxID=1572761 RepID=A0ABV6P758_9MICC